MGAKHYWFIEDPRGFIVPVTSDFLSPLLKEATIEKSEILEKCLWVFNKGTTFLTIEKGNHHYLGLENEKRYKDSITPGSLKIGHTYMTKTGRESVFLGSYYRMYYPMIDSCFNIIDCLNKKYYFFLETGGYVTSNLSPKIGYEISSDKFNIDIKDIPAYIKKQNRFCIDVFSEKINWNDVELSIEQISEADALNKSIGRLIVKLSNGKYSYINAASYPKYKTHKVKWSFGEINLEETLEHKKIILLKGVYNTETIKEYYQIRINYKNQNYNY